MKLWNKSKIVEVEIPDDDPRDGFKFNWTDGHEFDSAFEDGELVITANQAGLLSLANHLINLADDKWPSGHHFHFDVGVELDEGAIPVVFVKK